MASLTDKQLLILGLARQGTALARFAAGIGARVTVSDLRAADQLQTELAQLDGLPIKTVLGSHPESLLDQCDLLALSGSVPLTAPIVRAAMARGIPLTNDSQEVLRRLRPEQTIGITGSAGKTTTTALVGKIFETAGIKAWVGGNIGRPLIEHIAQIKPTDTVVQELSSFQLDLWTQSPHIAAVTNITPNHLDRHKTLEAYTNAKANILCHQSDGDVAILNRDDPGSARLAPRTQGRIRRFSLNEAVDDGGYLGQNGRWLMLRDGEREIPAVAVKHIPLIGRHNIANVLTALTIATTAHHIGPAALTQAVATFNAVPHRLELVAEQNGVRYINDSIATAPERALAGLAALNGEEIILLAGGKDKDMVWEPWAATVAQRVKKIILFGDLTELLAQKLHAAGAGDRTITAGTLEHGIEAARASAQAGDIVLLSPGGTSYDAFKDFEERGMLFKKRVESRE